MNSPKVDHARIADNGQYIIDSDGRRIEYDDPRVVHVYAIDNSPYAKRLMKAVFERSGRKYRAVGKTDAEVMQLAKQLCSGRECVPATAIVGHTLTDIYKNRAADEITLYFSLNQEGPCQNGAWPVQWDVFRQRLNVRNVIFLAANNSEANSYGLSTVHKMWLGRAIIVGHYLDEAENALRVVAGDADSAMEVFKTEAESLIKSIRSDNWRAFANSLKKWAENVSRIPICETVDRIPKVLIFGGLNLLFVHHPVTEFFIAQGVIPKVVDLAEGMLWLQSESIIKFGFRSGITDPYRQFNPMNMLYNALMKQKNISEAKAAFSDKGNMVFMDYYKKRYLNIMGKSGLMSDPFAKYARLAAEGHKYISNNTFSETCTTTGRYVCAVEDGVFDGLINLGSFNCQPAMNSQAIIRPLSNAGDVPYAAIDVEGPWITTNHRRLLETIAVQAKRAREMKNRKIP